MQCFQSGTGIAATPHKFYQKGKDVAKITVQFITLGCKTNLYESEAMAQLFRAAGYTIIKKDEKADIYVINTCTVTGTGAHKSRQQIRRIRRENPKALIAVCGCLAQTESEAISALGANLVIGNKYRGQIVSLVEQANQNSVLCKVDDILNEHTYEELTITNGQSRIRANLKIEDGCSNFCTYCIIPFARGPVRSREIENIRKEAESLAAAGFKELVLTGIHIGSYGKDKKDGKNLMDVIEAVCQTDGIQRVRLGSIEPVVITEDFVLRAKQLSALCPQFHLSLQSGSDDTLKRMNRHYTTDAFRQAVALLRRHIPDTAVTTDLMVGFPGETEQSFLDSYAFCREIGFSQMHIFKYSARQGTLAAKMKDQIPEAEKERRSRQMLTLAEDMKRTFYEQYIGKPVEVLLEQKNASGLFHGNTRNYMDVLTASSGHSGEIRTVVPTAYENGRLIARERMEGE